MERILGRIIMTLCCTILLVGAAQARTLKQVYLRDGGIIECQKVWKTNGKVMVLINRDTLLDLPGSEVDLKKTFAGKKAKGVKKSVKKGPARVAAAKPVAAPVAEGKPGAPPRPAPTVKKEAPPAMKQAAPEGGKPASQAVKRTAPEAAKTPPPAAAKKPEAAGQAVQQATTSAKKEAAGAASTTAEPPRAALPLAKAAAPPEEKKSFLAENMTNIGLGALLVLLIVGYVIYKKKQG